MKVILSSAAVNVTEVRAIKLNLLLAVKLVFTAESWCQNYDKPDLLLSFFFRRKAFKNTAGGISMLQYLPPSDVTAHYTTLNNTLALKLL